jgi:D-alanine-D-alanine ligase
MVGVQSKTLPGLCLSAYHRIAACAPFVMPGKSRLALVFGGRSSEHDISIRSATEVAVAIDRARWEVVLVGITRDGGFRLGEGGFGPAEVLRSGREVPDLAGLDVDVVFPLLHGPHGEDGAIQGYLETLALPYVGCGVLSSAVAMDKVVSKQLLAASGIETLPYRVIHLAEVEGVEAVPMAELVLRCASLGFPLFVKPANQGSSIGISRVTSADALPAALLTALRYDSKVLVEQAATAPREVELAVLGNDAGDLVVSEPGEIVLPEGAWYDFDNKYTNDVAGLAIPARLSSELRSRLRETARKAYLALECSGLSRIDFLVEGASSNDGADTTSGTTTPRIWLNEINTMPGFTSISMYPKLMAGVGIGYSQLVDKLCDLAIARHGARARLAASARALVEESKPSGTTA